MKKIFICFLYSTFAFSQGQQQQLPAIAPATPRVAELVKYGTYPVSLNTGIPEIKFDLYEIKVNEITIPIQLSYHAGGIKVSQEATEVGLGWSILGGEVIHRNVLGIDDDRTDGNFNIVPLSSQDLVDKYQAPIGQVKSSYQYLKTMARGGGPDSQPDTFSYTMNGGAGQFLYGRDRKFMTMPYQPLNITRKGKVVFEIINEQGTKHNFKVTNEVFYEDSQPMLRYITDWYVKSIVSNNKKDSIQFGYDIVPYYKTTISHSQTIGRNLIADASSIVRADPFYGGDGVSSQMFSQQECFIKQIDFNQGKVIFTYSTNRLDKTSDGNGRRLDAIEVYDIKNVLIKRIEFYYDYFQSPDSWGIKYRLRLIGFSEISSSGAKKEYKFEYNSDITIPAIGTYSQDYWGFYNGIGNQGLIPRVTIKGTEVGSTYIQDQNTTWSIGNADRSVDVTKMQMGMLKKIIYPTKGYTVFEFEPHAYPSQAVLPQTKTYGGRTDGKGANTKSENVYTFTPSKDAVASVALEFSPPMPAYLISEEHPQLIILKDLTTGVEMLRKWHDNDPNKPLLYTTNQNLIANHNYQLTVTVYGVFNTITANGYLATYARAEVKWDEPVTVPITSYGGGLRISSSKSYQADGTLSLSEIYKYGLNESGIGDKLFDEKLFFKNYNHTNLIAYEKCLGAAPNGMIEGWLRTYMGIESYSAVTSSGVPVIYKEVSKYTGTNAALTYKTKYNYELLMEYTGVDEAFINSGNYGSILPIWNQANLKMETQYKREGANYTPVQITESIYDKYYEKSNYGIMFKEKPKYLATAETGAGGCEPSSDDGYDPKWIMGRAITFWSRAYRKKQEKVTYYLPDASKTLETTTNFFYDNPAHMQLTRTEKIASDGKTISSKSFYPGDITSVSAVVPDLTTTEKAAIDRLKDGDLHRIAEPVQIESIVKDASGTVIANSIQRTTYKQWTTDLVLPEYLKSLKGTASSSTTMENQVVFHNYDDKGNPLEVSKANGMHIVYIWGYNKTQPIAKIENATYAEVSSYVSTLQLASDNSSLSESSFSSLRSNLSNAMITTFIYKPLIGVSSITDPKGDTVYYEYDDLNRLKFIKDAQGNLLSENQYKYKN
jgi:hypothetical protein